MWVNSWSSPPLAVPPLPQALAFPPFSQLFKGKFYHCLGVDTRNITNRSDCVAANYRWVHHKYNFDNLGQVSPSRVTTVTDLTPVLQSGSGWSSAHRRSKAGNPGCRVCQHMKLNGCFTNTGSDVPPKGQ